MPQRRAEEIVLGKGATAHELLKIIYQCPELPLPVRMRAAIASLPFETPKLAVSYQASETDFAELLDRRIRRMEEAKLIQHQPQTVEVRPPLPRIPDRRSEGSNRKSKPHK
jgi:hypothetical protein